MSEFHYPMNLKDLQKLGVRANELDLIEPMNATTVAYGSRNLNWKGKIGYFHKVLKARKKLDAFYKDAMARKECYYGPFKGEFGHFLLHNLPFLTHLHKHGVKIHYCGMELHKPFLIDERGNSMLTSVLWLRDFFGEIKPSSNVTVPPEDVQESIRLFKKTATDSGLPFLDIDDHDMYWFVFRNWQLDGKQGIYDLSSVYGKQKSCSCVIFPRKKGGEFSPNNGGPWDYMELARTVAPHFDKVYLVGHPSLSADVTSEGNIELKISTDNAQTLKYCAESDLIITQHSGAVHLGAYVHTPVLIVFNGKPPIKGLIDTIRFRDNLTDVPLNYAFNFTEIKNFAGTLKCR